MEDKKEPEEDVVIEEIPVYLTKHLKDGLFVFQYPTKNRVGTFDKTQVRQSSAKPLNQEVRVDFALDSSSANFDSFRAEQLAIAAGTKSRSKPDRMSAYNSNMLEAQTYTSTRLMTDASKYIVGIYADKEIHLTPIQNILQMRPSFPHFDKEDKRTKAEQKKISAQEEEKEEELQQVTVKFSRGSSNKKGKEKQDLASFLKQRKEEPWRKTQWHSRHSPTAEIERQKLYASTHETSEALAMDTNKYAKKLLPNQTKNGGIDAVLPPRAITKKHLKDMSLMEQLKALLKDVKMMSTTEIVTFLQSNVDSRITLDKVLRSLPQVGTLLHGNWIPQSEILYPKETVSNENGVCSEIMVRARDYVVFKFSYTPYLSRPEVIIATRLPPKEATDVLSSIARVNAEKKWELLLTPDKKFEQRHPDLVKRQERIWATSEHSYLEMDEEPSPKRVRKRSIRETKSQISQEQSQDSGEETEAKLSTEEEEKVS